MQPHEKCLGRVGCAKVDSKRPTLAQTGWMHASILGAIWPFGVLVESIVVLWAPAKNHYIKSWSSSWPETTQSVVRYAWDKDHTQGVWWDFLSTPLRVYPADSGLQDKQLGFGWDHTFTPSIFLCCSSLCTIWDTDPFLERAAEVIIHIHIHL